LRQVIARRQATQGLLGSDCLLPLKGGLAGFIGDRSSLQRMRMAFEAQKWLGAWLNVDARRVR